MTAKRKIEPVYDEKLKRWIVDVPATLATDGKRYKARFKTRDLAREHLADINGKEDPTAAIPPSLAMEADKARSILEPWNLDIVQAAREVAAALEVLNGSGSILEAVKAYRATHEARTASKTFGDAVKLYLTSREDLRDTTKKSYLYTLQKVFADLDGDVLADIQTSDIEAILSGKGPTSRKMHTRNLRVFWKWASTPPRQWASMAVVDALEAVRSSSDTDIAILSPAAVKALLKAAEAESPAAAIAYAVAVFGGVRMAELSRLTWSCVGGDHIEIGRAVAKKHSRRLIPICATLRAWIDEYRGASNSEDFLVGANWTDVSKSVRRRAGWDVAARLLEDPQKPTRGAWPSNACRHTCASVQVAIGTSLEDLTFKFGHSGGHGQLRAHYVSRLTKKDAIAILCTGPKGRKVAILAAA